MTNITQKHELGPYHRKQKNPPQKPDKTSRDKRKMKRVRRKLQKDLKNSREYHENHVKFIMGYGTYAPPSLEAQPLMSCP